ncbi:MAG: hypothetical protein ABSH41_06505 [Syntrophobacteraceae bacterium]
MKYYQIEPEVAGGIGEHSEIDRSSGKMVVRKLHYEFDGWGGDELLESTPCFIVSERLAHEIERAQLTGISFDDVEVTKSDQFEELYPNRQLPKFVWLQIDGKPGQDDFGIGKDPGLVISERALEVLKGLGISNALVTPFEEGQ